MSNKQNPSPQLSQKLNQLKYDLRILLLENFEKASRKLKMSYYATKKRVGKLLAQKFKGHTVDIRPKYRTFSTQNPTINYTTHKTHLATITAPFII